MAKKRIKDLGITAAASDLKAGNYLALDGAAGTKKLPANTIGDVLKNIDIETAAHDLDDEIEILDADGNCAVKFTSDGLFVADVNGGLHKVIAGPFFGKREISAAEIELLNDAGATLASVSNAGVFLKKLFVNIDGDAIDIEPFIRTAYMYLPEKVYAVVGDTLQIFFDSCIINSQPHIVYNVFIESSKGNIYPRYFEYKPNNSDVGEVPIQLQIQSSDGSVLCEKSATLITMAKATSPSSAVNIVCMGDSYTQDGEWVTECARRLIGSGGSPLGDNLSNVYFMGSRGDADIHWDGNAGWAWIGYVRDHYKYWIISTLNVAVSPTKGTYYKDGAGNLFYVNSFDAASSKLTVYNIGENKQNPQPTGTLTKMSGTGDNLITYTGWNRKHTNPFWNYTTGELDLVGYANQYCNGHIDCLVCLMGWNDDDVTPWKRDFSETISFATEFIEALHADFPQAKVLLGCPYVASPLGAVSATKKRDWLGMNYSLVNLCEKYKQLANSTQFAGYVEYFDARAQFDSLYGTRYENKPVNVRSDVTEIVSIDIHPNNSGYMQIADSAYRHLTKIIKEY